MAQILCRLIGHKYHNDKLLIAFSGHNNCIRCNAVRECDGTVAIT